MRALLALAFAASLAACRKDPPPPNGNMTVSVGNYSTSASGAQIVSINGITIQADPDLPERTSGTQAVTGDNMTVVVLRGWPVAVGGEKLLVAGQEFGAVPKNVLIRLSKEGVYVGDELRGPLP